MHKVDTHVSRTGIKEMTVKRALLKKKNSRISCFPIIDVAFAATHVGELVGRLELEPALHAEALCRCLKELPVDGVYINLCFDLTQAKNVDKVDSGYKLVIDEAVEIIVPENDVASIKRSYIKSFNDPRIVSAKLFHPGILATFKEIKKCNSVDGAVVVGITGAFTQLVFLYGLENLFYAMIDDPNSVKKAIEKRQHVAIDQVKEIRDAGAEFIWVGEGPASGSLISPQMYREFVFPYERELAHEIRRMGMLSLLHICGNTTALLDDIAQSGFDGYDLDYLVSINKGIDVLLPHITIKGNINPLLFLHGNERELLRACQKIKQTISHCDDSFIMSTGCLVPRDASEEAFHIMAKTCHC